jgi:hypothetical protein
MIDDPCNAADLHTEAIPVRATLKYSDSILMEARVKKPDWRKTNH